MHLLENAAAQPSAVNDMESFFWTFLYALLHMSRDALSKADKDLFKQLVPDSNRDYGTDASAKSRILMRMKKTGSAAYDDSVLKPYRDYMAKMALLALNLNDETLQSGFAGYDLQAELGVIHEYISTFEMLLKDLQQKTTSG